MQREAHLLQARGAHDLAASAVGFARQTMIPSSPVMYNSPWDRSACRKRIPKKQICLFSKYKSSPPPPPPTPLPSAPPVLSVVLARCLTSPEQSGPASSQPQPGLRPQKPQETPAPSGAPTDPGTSASWGLTRSPGQRRWPLSRWEVEKGSLRLPKCSSRVRIRKPKRHPSTPTPSLNREGSRDPERERTLPEVTQQVGKRKKSRD